MNHSNLREINRRWRLEVDLENVRDDDFKDDEIMWAGLNTSIHLHSQHSVLTKSGSLATQIALKQSPISEML